MIINTSANALVQCSARTQAGWITLAVVDAACSSLTVTADMASLRDGVFQEGVIGSHKGNASNKTGIRYRLYAGNLLFVTTVTRPNRRMAGIVFTKKRAG